MGFFKELKQDTPKVPDELTEDVKQKETSLSDENEKKEEGNAAPTIQETYKFDSSPTVYDGDATVITAGCAIEGNVENDGSIAVYGSVTGNINCTGKLSVTGMINGDSACSEFFADTARMAGNIICTGTAKIGSGTVVVGNLTAGSAVIAGSVKGDLDIKGPVIVDTTAVIMGNIKSKLIQINNGAVVEGTLSQCYSDKNASDYFDKLING